MSTVAAVILGKERRMVATFETHGAVSREQAKTLEQLGITRGVILRRLRERAVVREAAHDHFYLDRESWSAVRRSRRRAVHVIAVILLALLLALIFGTRKARAGEERLTEGIGFRL
jgi:hypothetical protein